ncbi:hypothetical protein BKI52_01245 [marine bacterium AO1-C]|nr:hypothetical protein BKI52_01245 [marine bacterium AO1-C]
MKTTSSGRLTPQQKQIMQLKRISGIKTTTEWLALFENLIPYDKKKRKAFDSWGQQLQYSILLAILGFVATVIFVMQNIDQNLILGVLFVIISMILIAILNQRISNAYLADYFRTVLVPLVLALHEEMPEDAPLGLKADLRHQFNDGHYTAGGLYKWNLLQVSGKLHNGVSFWLNIRIINRYKGHHTHVHKTKSKRRVVMNLQMNYPKKYHKMVHVLRLSHPYKEKYKEKSDKYILKLRHTLKFKNRAFDENRYKDVPLAELMLLIRTGFQALEVGKQMNQR